MLRACSRAAATVDQKKARCGWVVVSDTLWVSLSRLFERQATSYHVILIFIVPATVVVVPDRRRDCPPRQRHRRGYHDDTTRKLSHNLSRRVHHAPAAATLALLATLALVAPDNSLYAYPLCPACPCLAHTHTAPMPDGTDKSDAPTPSTASSSASATPRQTTPETASGLRQRFGRLAEEVGKSMDDLSVRVRAAVSSAALVVAGASRVPPPTRR